MSDSPRIGLWDTYQQQFNPFVIEEDEEFRDMTLDDIYEILIRSQTKKLKDVLGVKS